MKRLSVVLMGVLLVGPGFSALRADDAKTEDSKFLKEAASGGMLEVKLGELAVQQAQNPEVRASGNAWSPIT